MVFSLGGIPRWVSVRAKGRHLQACDQDVPRGWLALGEGARSLFLDDELVACLDLSKLFVSLCLLVCKMGLITPGGGRTHRVCVDL